jgi:hypothetical protein
MTTTNTHVYFSDIVNTLLMTSAAPSNFRHISDLVGERQVTLKLKFFSVSLGKINPVMFLMDCGE